MRWDALFADLEARAAALEVAERAGEVDERARAALARVDLRSRLGPAVGTPVRLRCAGGLSVAGVLRRAGAAWLLVDEGGGRECVVLLAGLLTVSGLGRISAVPGSEPVVESRLGVAHVLRGLARDRSAVRLRLVDGSALDGTLDRVGQDFVELAVHPPGEPRRRSAVLDAQVVPFAALVSLHRDR